MKVRYSRAAALAALILSGGFGALPLAAQVFDPNVIHQVPPEIIQRLPPELSSGDQPSSDEAQPATETPSSDQPNPNAQPQVQPQAQPTALDVKNLLKPWVPSPLTLIWMIVLMACAAVISSNGGAQVMLAMARRLFGTADADLELRQATEFAEVAATSRPAALRARLILTGNAPPQPRPGRPMAVRPK